MKKIILKIFIILNLFIIINTSNAQYDNAFYNSIILDKLDIEQIELYKRIYDLKNSSTIPSIKNFDIEKIDTRIDEIKDFKSDPSNKPLPDLKVFSELKEFLNLTLSKKEFLENTKNELTKSYNQENTYLLNNKIVYETLINKQSSDSIFILSYSQTTGSLNITATETYELKVAKILNFKKEYENKKLLVENTLKSLTQLDEILILLEKAAIIELPFYKISEVSELKAVLPPSYTSKEMLDAEVKSSQSEFKLSQSAIIDAVVSYIAEKAKEELIDDVFNGLISDNIKNNLKLFFPKTISHITSLKSAGFTLNNFNSTIQKLFKDDLKGMLVNLSDEKNLNGTIFNNLRYQPLYRYFSIGVSIIENQSNGFHPIDLIPLLKDKLDKDFQNFKTLNDVKLFVPADYYKPEYLKKNKISYEKILTDFKGNSVLKTILQDIINIDAVEENTNYELISERLKYLDEVSSSFNEINKFSDYIKIFNVLQKNLRETDNETNKEGKNIWISFRKLEQLNPVKNPKGAIMFAKFLMEDMKKEKYYDPNIYSQMESNLNDIKNLEPFFNKLSDVLIKFNSLEKSIESLTSSKNGTSSSDYEKYLENFSKIIFDTDDLLASNFYGDRLIKDNIRTIFISGTEVFKSISNGTYVTLFPNLIKILKELKLELIEKNREFIDEKLLKYVSFVAEASNSKSQDEFNNSVSKIFEKSTSYQRKFEKSFTLSINSFPGLGFGYYFSPEIKRSFTLSVPIGFEFSCHIYKTESLGILLSVFDLGAPFEYRLNTNAPLPSDLTFKQLFSPGIFLRFTEIPFAKQFKFLLGYQYLPELEQVNDLNQAESKEDRRRIGLHLTYDLPLFFIF